MFKPKTPRDGRLEKSSGAQIRTEDLRVMSPTSCHCSTPHYYALVFGRANYSTAILWRQGAIELCGSMKSAIQSCQRATGVIAVWSGGEASSGLALPSISSMVISPS